MNLHAPLTMSALDEIIYVIMVNLLLQKLIKQIKKNNLMLQLNKTDNDCADGSDEHQNCSKYSNIKD